MRIEDATALVTGAGSGLGEATATLLASLGARVGVFDRDGQAAEKVAARIDAVALIGDVTSETDVDNCLDALIAANGPLRILVNCAGIGTAKRIVGRDGPMPLADFEKVIRVNLIGTFNMLRLCSARMADSEPLDDGARGAIVNTASVAAFDGQIGQAAYAASKGGITSLALPAARELARFGIRVNTLAPGIFMTPLLGELPEESRASLAAGIPYPSRLGLPAEFAEAVRFCIENQYLNGETIRLDGATRLQPK